MSTTRELPDWKLELERKQGRYVCACLHPVPVRLGLWGADQCARCGKLVVT
jgi:hypothetical protein